MYFARANRFTRSSSALTDYLGLTKGTVSQTINAVERKGLVKKTAVVGDARAVNITMAAYFASGWATFRIQERRKPRLSPGSGPEGQL